MVQMLAEHNNSHSRLKCAEQDTDRQLRAALIRVGGYLGLDKSLVIRFSETITGRAWSRCGAAQVVEIGKRLLDLALAVKGEHQSAVGATRRPTAVCCPLSTAAMNSGQLLRPVGSNSRRGGKD